MEKIFNNGDKVIFLDPATVPQYENYFSAPAEFLVGKVGVIKMGYTNGGGGVPDYDVEYEIDGVTKLVAMEQPYLQRYHREDLLTDQARFVLERMRQDGGVTHLTAQHYNIGCIRKEVTRIRRAGFDVRRTKKVDARGVAYSHWALAA